MNALIYTRVATKRQAERSGPIRQEEACRAYCEQKGWDIVGVWHEVGSAGDGWRFLPTLFELVTTILPVHQPAMLVAEDFSRFTQAGIADSNDLDQMVREHGGRLASPQLESPIIERMLNELYPLFLEMQRQGGVFPGSESPEEHAKKPADPTDEH